ncbi:hypothetical protein KW805_02990 [Candidatus Pacearchaeota archaeon]|nr:hypothetical protein [Candidatus Pacearchaeota archaeon]
MSWYHPPGITIELTHDQFTQARKMILEMAKDVRHFHGEWVGHEAQASTYYMTRGKDDFSIRMDSGYRLDGRIPDAHNRYKASFDIMTLDALCAQEVEADISSILRAVLQNEGK